MYSKVLEVLCSWQGSTCGERDPTRTTVRKDIRPFISESIPFPVPLIHI